uniref:Uncharacterized protein n=1 Tax=viral metagenome TaxID=1070528 RepID=A0A6C0CAZ7_9ZZZZ
MSDKGKTFVAKLDVKDPPKSIIAKEVPKTVIIDDVPKTVIKTIDPNLIEKDSYFKLDGAQYAIVIGIALSSMMSFVQIYNSISKINDQEKNDLREETKAALQTRFIVMMVMASLAIVGGVGLGMYYKDGNEYQLLTFSLIIGGVVSMIYALVDKYENEPWMTYTKLGLSLTSLAGFVLLGFLYQTNNQTLMSFIKKYR